MPGVHGGGEGTEALHPHPQPCPMGLLHLVVSELYPLRQNYKSKHSTRSVSHSSELLILKGVVGTSKSVAKSDRSVVA